MSTTDPLRLPRIAARPRLQAIGATSGTKANCHSDYVDDETAKTLQAVELVELETP